MALAIDGTPQSSTGTTGPTVTFSLTTTQSNDIIIVGSASNGTSITGITGPGLTFAQRAIFGTHTTPVEEWYAVASSPLSSASIVITYGQTGNFYAATAFAISGANTSTIWDSNGGIPVIGGTAADPSVSTTNANDIIIGILRFANTTAPTPGAGWTGIATLANSGFLVQYKIVSSAQSGLTVAVGTGSGDENGYVVDAVIQAAPPSIGIVQSAAANGGTWPTTNSVTLNGVTAGNAILIVTPAVINTSGSPTLTITDSVNSVTELEQIASFGLSSVFAILDFSIIPNASAGSHTLTATVGSGTGFGFIVAIEIYGLESSATLDVFSLNAAGGGSNPSTGNTGTPASVNEIAIAAVSGYYTGAALTIGEPSGYNNISRYEVGDGHEAYSIDYLTPVALSAQSASWTGMTTINSFAAGVIVLKAASNQATVMWWV